MNPLVWMERLATSHTTLARIAGLLNVKMFSHFERERSDAVKRGLRDFAAENNKRERVVEV